MNKKGFTLIELLAVIIILGILMLIAIPSVTGYINNSRKETYVSTIKELIKGTSTKVNNGDIEVYDKNTTYYIPVSGLTFENGEIKSPYADFDEAYVVVTTNGEEYEYFFVGKDKSDIGVDKPIKNSNLTSTSINTDVDDIETNIGIDNRKNVIVFENDLKTIKKQEEASINIDSKDGVVFNLVCKRAKTLHKDYCGSSACISAGFEEWQLITFGNLGIEGTYEKGDAFDCDVNGDNVYDKNKERFYYLYDSNDQAILIFGDSVSHNGSVSTYGRSVYHETDNWHGPEKLLDSLPSKDVWKNVSLSNTKRQILNENHESSNLRHDLPVFDYGDKAARILTLEEFQDACNLPHDSGLSRYDPNNCLFLFDLTAFYLDNADSIWLENTYSREDNEGLIILTSGNRVTYDKVYRDTANARPVIEVPLNKIEQ